MMIYFATSNAAEAARRMRLCFPGVEITDEELAPSVQCVIDGLIRVNEVYGARSDIFPARELKPEELKRVQDTLGALQKLGLERMK